jgi:archaellum component FlaC
MATPSNGYKQLVEAIREELRPIKETVDRTETNLEALRRETYPRELMDEKLKAIDERLKGHDEDLKGIHNLIGNSWRELLERVGVVAGIAYSLVYVIPRLFGH